MAAVRRGRSYVRVFTVQEAAAELGVGERTLWTWIAASRIACSRCGRVVRLTEGDLAEFLSRHRRPAREHLAAEEGRRQ